MQPLTVVSKIAPKPAKPTVITTSKTISAAQMVMIPTITTTLAPANKIPLAPANKVAIPPSQPNPNKLAASLNASLKAALSSNEGSPPIMPKDEPDSNGKFYFHINILYKYLVNYLWNNIYLFVCHKVFDQENPATAPNLNVSSFIVTVLRMVNFVTCATV